MVAIKPLAKTETPKASTPLPGVVPGDEVYVQHPKTGPHVGVVQHMGAHGACLHINGKQHNVEWPHIVGIRRRVSQSYDVVDEGEDGMVVRDGQGRRHFIAIPPDAREDKLMVKSLNGQRVVLLKATKRGKPLTGAPGLSKRQITDKNGTNTTKWVKTAKDAPAVKPPAPGEVPAAPRALPGADSPRKTGDKVSFQSGDFKGSGEIVGTPGKDGAHVKDASGRVHQARHDEMSGTPDKPEYEAREDGETDKSYAKRIVDKGDVPATLPEDPERYFDTEGSTHVPLDKLHDGGSGDDDQDSDNGPKRMLATYQGSLGKRAPIKVMPHASKPGSFEVVDGHSTVAAARKVKWLGLPAHVVGRDEGLRRQADAAATEAAKIAVDVEKYTHLPKSARQPLSDQKALYQKAGEALEQLKLILTGGDGKGGIAADMGLRVATKSPGKVTPEEWDEPGGMLFIAGLKPAEGRAAQKVKDDYEGDWSMLKDIVRCTIALDNLHDVKKAMDKLESAGVEVMQQPKDKFTKPTAEGYRDFNLIMKMPNGIAAEVQLNVKDMLKAKNVGHHEYEITRTLEGKNRGKPDASWSQAEAQEHARSTASQKKTYGDAWSAHTQAHYASKKDTQDGGAENDSKMLKSHRLLVVFGSRRGAAMLGV